ncbi:MAG: hypothetical protein ACLFVO_06695 [Chloroflexaceae bacterium]
MNNEADTRRHYITPQLIAAGWDDPPHSFTRNTRSIQGASSLMARANRSASPRAGRITCCATTMTSL